MSNITAKYEQLKEMIRADRLNTKTFATGNNPLHPLMFIRQFGEVGFIEDDLYVRRMNSLGTCKKPEKLNPNNAELIDYLLWAGVYENGWSDYHFSEDSVYTHDNAVKLYTAACLTYFHEAQDYTECYKLWHSIDSLVSSVKTFKSNAFERVYNNAELFCTVMQTLMNSLDVWPTATTRYGAFKFMQGILDYYRSHSAACRKKGTVITGEEGTELVAQFTVDFTQKLPVTFNNTTFDYKGANI